jgi:hypothetical protein
MYDSASRAQEAVQALVQAGVSADWITTVSPGPDAHASLQQASEAGRLPKGYLGPCTRSVDKGRTVVSASGPMHVGVVIEGILEKFEPVGSNELPQHGGSVPDPFSQMLGIATLSRRQKPTMGALTRSDFALTSFIPLLTRDGNAMFGGLTRSDFALTSFMPLLSRGGKPMFGGLTSSDFSFSSMLGLPLLSKNGTPLSSFLGLNTLSGRDDSK